MTWGKTVAVLGVVLLVLAAAPAGGEDASGSPLDDVDCAWPIVVDKPTLNIAYPDTATSYWVSPLELGPGDSATVAGGFPDARYASLTSYDSGGALLGGVEDARFTTVEGTNPYADPEGTGGRFEIGLVPTADPGTPGSDGSGDGEVADLPLPVGLGYLIYRVYLPVDASDPTGSTPLPTVTVTRADGTTEVLEACTTYRNELMVQLGVLDDVGGALARALPPAPQPDFVWPDQAGGLFPNRDNAYLYATTAWEPGSIIVVRGQAPSFPDTPTEPPTTPRQVRFFSMCTNLLISPAPVVECASDADTVLDDEGRFTYVISAAVDRPDDASLAAASATWLDWFDPATAELPGDERPDGILLMRHMLPAPDFAEAIQNITEGRSGSAAKAVMGDFYPDAVYCHATTFASGGADACFARATVAQPLLNG